MVQVTFLSWMADPDLAVAARRHRELGISVLDIKDGVFGKKVEDLSPEEAKRAGENVRDGGCSVDCLSSSIGFTPLAEGEGAFVEQHVAALKRLLVSAEWLRPRVIRLLAPRRLPGQDYAAAMRESRWVIGAFRRLVDMASGAGFEVLIENETSNCLLTTPSEILDFITRIDRPGKLKAIYDVQNLWQMGWFPTVDSIRQLAPVLGGLHLKGGRGDEGGKLTWASPLETATWPVLDVTRAAIDLGKVPVICLNPSHGKKPEGYDIWEVAKQDLRFLRQHIPEIEGHGLPA